MARFRDEHGRPIEAGQMVPGAAVGDDEGVPGTAVTRAGIATDPSPDPIVGWLVITDGPGRGTAITLGYGENTIGSGEGARVQLDFGDSHIAGMGHALVDYDPFERRFLARGGFGGADVKVNGKPVSEPVKLSAGDRIALGGTVLRFVPLCGPKFSWDEA